MLVYDKIGFKFYKVDFEIEWVKNLFESCIDNEKLEKEIFEFESIILIFIWEFLECKKFFENFERFLKEVKNRLKFGLLFDFFDLYYKDLKEFLYSSNFDEFKKWYIEY